MSRDSGRPRAASGQRSNPARGTTSNSRQRNGSHRPAQRRGERTGSRTASSSVRSAEQQNALSLDRALQAAQAVPAPPPATFGALGVPKQLVAELAARGIHEPFAIQARALPDALAGRDVLGRAQTGSGKTLAFGLPMLARLAEQSASLGTDPAAGHQARRASRAPKAPRGLVLVPTRELAVQVADVLVPLGRTLNISVMTVYGGVAISRQLERLRHGIDIIVATPGRLLDVMDRGACSLSEVSITVLDEADHMADLGFLPSVTKIIDATPDGGQRMLFSATLDRGVAGLVTKYLADPALHAVAPAGSMSDVEHEVFVLPAADKLAVAAEIASREGRTLFFVRTKHGADRLAKQLSRAGVPAAAIHGNLNQNQRQRALAAFTAGEPRVLVATDVAARGIHVDGIGLVVHYDPPNDHKDYLHRSGRTARAGATGTVLALVDPSQVRDVGKMHDAAGISSVSHHVEPGHQAVRKLASSGTAIIPAPPAAPVQPRPHGAPARLRPHRPAAGSGQRARPRRAAS